ncbi:unnamed protein product [Rhizophagus irregularis]|nr:unnamed protein product [Rhizophagus irregularis]
MVLFKDWPSSSRAEASAIYAALTVTPPDSTVKICTDSQTAMDGLRYAHHHLIRIVVFITRLLILNFGLLLKHLSLPSVLRFSLSKSKHIQMITGTTLLIPWLILHIPPLLPFDL